MEIGKAFFPKKEPRFKGWLNICLLDKVEDLASQIKGAQYTKDGNVNEQRTTDSLELLEWEAEWGTAGGEGALGGLRGVGTESP